MSSSAFWMPWGFFMPRSWRSSEGVKPKLGSVMMRIEPFRAPSKTHPLESALELATAAPGRWIKPSSKCFFDGDRNQVLSLEHRAQLLRSIHQHVGKLLLQRVRRESVSHPHRPKPRIASGLDIHVRISHDGGVL